MNTLARYAVFILFMGVIIISLAGAMPFFYKSVTGTVKVARIPVHSTLSIDSDILSSISGVDAIIAQLDAAEQNSEIKAVLLDINSPGGGPVASYELVRKIKLMTKPVVSVIREIGASGAYWVAAASDYIIASELSMVGSVGAIASYLNFAGLMEKYGVTEVRAVSGEQKDFGSQFRNLTEQELEDLNELVNKSAQVFFDDVVALRGLNNSVSAEVVTGKIFLGYDAASLGLIDELGGLSEAQDYLMSLLGASVIEYVEEQGGLSVLDLISGFSTDALPLLFQAEGISLFLE